MPRAMNELGIFGYLSVPPAGAVKEILEWGTDVATAFDGTEERQQVRPVPRKAFQAAFEISTQDFPDAYNTLYGGLRESWAFPLWQYAQRAGDVASGATSTPCVTGDRNFVSGEMCFLWSPISGGVLKIVDTVAPDNVSWTAALGADSREAWIMPVARGYIPDDPSRLTSGSASEIEFTFYAEHPHDLTEDVPTQWLGMDVLLDPNFRSGDMADGNFAQKVYSFDPGLGPVSRYSPWRYPQLQRTRHLVSDSLSEAASLHRWLNRRTGRYRPFWWPTFQSDLRVVSISGTTLTVEKDSLTDWSILRKHLALFGVGGTVDLREIQAWSPSGARVDLTLDSAPSLTVDRISYASWMGQYRLSSDQVEMRWSQGTLSSSMNFLEVLP